MPWVVKSILLPVILETPLLPLSTPTPPPPYYSVSLLHRSHFWLSIIKEGILTGSYKKMAATFGGED